MANCDGPTAMLLPSLFERFCSYNCDGLLEGQGQGKGKGQEAREASYERRYPAMFLK
jgi:hypothetical protein